MSGLSPVARRWTSIEPSTRCRSGDRECGRRGARRRIVGTLFSVLPVPVLSGVLGVKLLLPYYHVVSDQVVAHTRHLYRHRTVVEFCEDLEYLLCHYQPVSMDDIVQHVTGNKEIRARSFHLTFDDGFREMHDIVAPILLARGVPATFFVCKGFLDNQDLAYDNKRSVLMEHLRSGMAGSSEGMATQWRAISEPWKVSEVPDPAALELKAEACGFDFRGYLQQRRPYLSSAEVAGLLSRGFAVGGHSVTHPRYGSLSLTEQLEETRESVDHLVRTFGVRDRTFAFPFTDAGIHPEFFHRAARMQICEVFFGNQGLLTHPCAAVFQRVSMEKSSLSAGQILGWAHARRLVKRGWRPETKVGLAAYRVEPAPSHAQQVSVCIITYRRPVFLRRLLDALSGQRLPSAVSMNVVVVDNDAQESARAVVEGLGGDYPWRVDYLVEPRKNLAVARNRAMEAATGEFIAFIDDDEVPTPTWLYELHRTMLRFDVSGVLGPVLPHYESPPPPWILRSGVFDRPRYPTGYRLGWNQTRTGNVLLHRSVADAKGERFNERFAVSSEDKDFFKRVMANAQQFVWCDSAVVYETQPRDRYRRRYHLRRALLRGAASAAHVRSRSLGLAKSGLAIGLYGAALPLLLLGGHHLFMRYLIKTCDHLSRSAALLGLPIQNWLTVRS
jgi:succinoglycan biosynthesis protein ExoM